MCMHNTVSIHSILNQPPRYMAASFCFFPLSNLMLWRVKCVFISICFECVICLRNQIILTRSNLINSVKELSHKWCNLLRIESERPSDEIFLSSFLFRFQRRPSEVRTERLSLWMMSIENANKHYALDKVTEPILLYFDASACVCAERKRASYRIWIFISRSQSKFQCNFIWSVPKMMRKKIETNKNRRQQSR